MARSPSRERAVRAATILLNAVTFDDEGIFEVNEVTRAEALAILTAWLAHNPGNPNTNLIKI